MEPPYVTLSTSGNTQCYSLFMLGGTVTQDEIVDAFVRGELTANEMVERLSELRPKRRHDVDLREEQIPETLVQAQAALRRINRGRSSD